MQRPATIKPATMKAVVTTGNGGYDRLVWCDVPVPAIGPGEVLLRVLAAGVNNTEINTRLGWYSSPEKPDGGWNIATPFPFIQGTDCCGRGVRPQGFGSMESLWMGVDFDGAFAEYVKVPAVEVFEVHCDWTDAALASIPCAYATAENMLHRARAAAGEHVLVTGASGGVGSAAVQLAKRRGARVTAIAASSKTAEVRAIGADRVIDRHDDAVAALGEESVDLVVDNVAGPHFDAMLKVLRRGGRYASSGAIGGPIVSLDLRRAYLKDLNLLGCTAWDEPVFPNLIGYIERGEIRPLVAATFPLERIADAQRAFLEKHHVGKFVLLPPVGGMMPP